MSSTDELLHEIEEGGSGSTNTQSDARSTGAGTETETESRRSRLTDTISQVFSPRSFLVSLALISIGLFVARFIPIPATGLIGVFLAAFALGVLSSEQRYLEIGVAGAVASGVGAFLSSPLLAIVGRLGIEFVGAGAVVGALVALIGCYFGRDLRGGLTKEIE